MKKIFLICTKTIENLDIFTPNAGKDAQRHLTLLLLHKVQSSEIEGFSQVWNLKGSEQNTREENFQKDLSYQDFLEQIFSHDLSVVI